MHELAIVLLLAAAAGPGSVDAGRPAPADGAAGMVIVTDSTLVAPFSRLASAHGKRGLPTRVRTLQSIRVAYPVARDDAERIRMFLEDARAHWGIEFVLLGGDEPLIPMRRAWLDQLPARLADNGLLLPTDQYYACLDGDWNADADARWGEAPDPRTGERGDDTDAIPELCVGRAPVTDERQADVFVEKTIRALEHPAGRDPLDVLVVAAGSLDPAPRTIPRFAPLAEDLASRLPRPATSITRLYRNEGEGTGARALTRTSALAALRKGPDLLFLLGFGGPGSFALDTNGGPETLDAEELLALHGPNARGQAIALSAFTNVPGRPSVGAALVRDEHGGCVSVLGPTDVEVPSLAAANNRTYLHEVIAHHAATIGEAMRAALRTMRLPPARDNVRLTTLGNVLLGDPALPFPAGPAPASRGDAGSSSASGAPP